MKAPSFFDGLFPGLFRFYPLLAATTGKHERFVPERQRKISPTLRFLLDLGWEFHTCGCAWLGEREGWQWAGNGLKFLLEGDPFQNFFPNRLRIVAFGVFDDPIQQQLL